MSGRAVVAWLRFAESVIDRFTLLRAAGLRVTVLAVGATDDDQLRAKLLDAIAELGLAP